MNDWFYHINYRFTSYLSDIEYERYVTEIEGDIIANDLDEKQTHVAGKIKVNILRWGLAMNENVRFAHVLDALGGHYGVAEDDYYSFFDAKTDELSEAFVEKFGDLDGHDICIIESVELLPAHRSKQVGRKVIKDIVDQFSSGCSLFIVTVFPFQFGDMNDDDWDRKMQYGLLETDQEQANYQLLNFFKQIGFDKLHDNDLMFYNPALVNERMDKIELD